MNPLEDTEVLGYIKSLKILCVEDNLTTQLIYETMFEDFVEEVIYCNNGLEGYNSFLDNDIDIILTDYSMPVLNGIEMIKKIRDINTTIPIILVSNIEDLSVVTEAIELEITSFIRKPIITTNIKNSIAKTSKLLIADKYLQEQKDKKLHDLEKKDKYNSYQEDLAFTKELNILKNDFYYQMLNVRYPSMIDFMYKPLDTVSGDAYSARMISEYKTFYLIVDGMGKGLSASLSAILMTSFINYLIDTCEDSDLDYLVDKSIEYIKPILLEDEALSLDYIILDYQEEKMHYAKFSMPSSLIQNNKGEVIKIKSNNPPLSKYTKNFTISTCDTSDISKYLFYSDGIVENTTNINEEPYEKFIYDDFSKAFSREDLRTSFLQKIDIQEDDITFIFINRLNLVDNIISTKSFSSTLDEIENANDWYCEIWEGLSNNNKITYNAGVVFSELFMNAFEHGNLGIDNSTKHKLLEDNTYFSMLESMQTTCDKKIDVIVSKINYADSTYIITQIIDEGDGFNTQMLSEIFRNTDKFNGRGVFVSRRSSMGIYYNKTGNSVLFLHRL